MSIIERSFGTTYDPDTVRVMSEAYDAAVKALRDRGQPLVVQEVIAKRTMELAGLGERDPERLAQTLLAEFGIAGGRQAV